MSQPTSTEVHVDRPLTDYSVAYIQDDQHFVSNKVYPYIQSDKQSDKYYVYTQADWFRDEARRRPPATESAGSGYGLSTETFLCENWSIHTDVPVEVVQNADIPLMPFQDAAEFVTQRMLLRQEIQWVSDFFAGSIWGTTSTGGTNFTQWDDYPNSNPIGDIETGKETILQNTGMMPNTLVLGYQAYRILKQHPDLLDLIKYTSGRGTFDAAAMANLFGLNVYVAKAVKNTAAEGATASYSFTHGKHAWLGYVDPRPGIKKPTAGAIFVWTGVSDGLGVNIGISKIFEPLRRSTRVEAMMSWVNKIVASNLGYFYSGAIS